MSISGLKSVFFRPTGRFNAAGVEEKEPIFLSNRITASKSLYINGDIGNGPDVRLNAAAASPMEATGYQILIDTMTYIKQLESKQSYFELGIQGLTPASFVPYAVGEGSWASNILTKRVYTNFGDFEQGLTRQGSNGARVPNNTASIDSVSIPTFIWEEGVQYNIAEIEQAMLAGNWDVIAAKHTSRHTAYQQGIQISTFLGTKSGSMVGLFNNTSVNINTSFITAYINSLNTANFATFVQGLMNLFWQNSNSTKLPTHFVIPMADYLGLMTPVPGTTTLTPMITYLKLAFEAICGSNFKIIGSPYADKTTANSLRGYNFNTYALYRHDAEAFRRDIPVDYTVTQPGTINNYTFQDVAYAQMTGIGFYKPLELLLFTF